MRTRTHYLPIEDASVGMLLAEAVRDHFQMPLLPAGSTLNAENLQQLLAHGVDFLCIAVADERSDEDIAAQTEEATRCVTGIFASADLAEPVMAALFNQILLYRST
jgi:thiamine monophosphate synthase